jgi:hypothetical protein
LKRTYGIGAEAEQPVYQISFYLYLFKPKEVIREHTYGNGVEVGHPVAVVGASPERHDDPPLGVRDAIVARDLVECARSS